MELILTAVLAMVGGDDKDDLGAAGKKSAELKSFSFQGETKVELPSIMGGMGDAGPTKFQGKHERDVGSYVRTGTHEFFMVGKDTVSRPIAEWKKVTDEGDDPMAMQKNVMKMFSGSRAVTTPTGDLADLGKKISKAKKKEAAEKVGDAECAVYEAELTEAAAEGIVQDSMPMGRMMKMGGGEVTHTGTLKAWVDGEGRIVKYEVTGKMSMSVQGMDLDMSSTKTVTLSGFDRTRVEIPEDARKALGE